MARRRALDYDDKRKAILDRSAELFAGHGYDGASISMIAEACGVSKALLYHYYGDKAELLFDVIRTHLEDLIQSVEEVARDHAEGARRGAPRGPGAPPCSTPIATPTPSTRCRSTTSACCRRTGRRRSCALERRLVRGVRRAVRPRCRASPTGPLLVKPVTMSLFGMLNWSYLWFRPDGPISREQYADLATRLILDGASSIGAEEMAALTARRAS
jgi:TetR/AcrR family transcriptional regulator